MCSILGHKGSDATKSPLTQAPNSLGPQVPHKRVVGGLELCFWEPVTLANKRATNSSEGQCSLGTFGLCRLSLPVPPSRLRPALTPLPDRHGGRSALGSKARKQGLPGANSPASFSSQFCPIRINSVDRGSEATWTTKPHTVQAGKSPQSQTPKVAG